MWLDWDRMGPGSPDSRSGCGGRTARAAEQRAMVSFRRDRRAPRIPSPGAPMPYANRLAGV